ncbi:MAG: DNA repair protein RecO [Chlamydiota bacterium]
MVEKKQEGIVLSAFDYRESSRIISLFTPDAGIINLIIKRIAKTKTLWMNLTTPLCHGHFIYRIKRSSLHHLIDGHILNLHIDLRNSYAHLTEAGKMLRSLSQSQLHEKPAPLLYQLLLAYLRQLPRTPYPETLGASFLLKTLKHDGLIALSSSCLRCRIQPSSALEGGESLCLSCASPTALAFSSDDWATLHDLYNNRQFSPLIHLELPVQLIHSIDTLFKRLIA